ncbi:MAG: DUF2357 domain-containing protein, partial [Clostridia bacterium]|nr:DUF2357 domain-containing protein [Clostridia bacterium]
MADEEKTEQKNGGDSFKKVYEDATYFVDSMVKEYRVFPMILGFMREGNASIELKKRYMLRAIDETWVNIIEDTIPCIEVLTRNPSKFIEEREELLPIELSRNISPRSLQHLSQHTNLISKIEGDKITPSKILNVFREETIQTYENKFLNTLINRLYTFVARRYQIAKKAGQDEKTTSLEFLDDFTHENVKVKMQFKMEISESTEGMGEKVEKNFTYTTDLWRRVEKLYEVVATFASSPFVQEMGNSFIRPPVMRTNAILKNKNLRQCLALWQFIESYEAAGYSMLVQEDLEKVDDEYVRELYSTLALQYLIFRHNIQNEFDAENVLASDLTDEELRPRMVSEFSKEREGDYDVSVPDSAEKNADRKQPMPSMIRYGTLTPEDKMMLESLDAALDAAEILRQGDPERPPLPEPKTEEELLAEARAFAEAEEADSEEAADAAAVSRQPSADSEEAETPEEAADAAAVSRQPSADSEEAETQEEA